MIALGVIFAQIVSFLYVETDQSLWLHAGKAKRETYQVPQLVLAEPLRPALLPSQQSFRYTETMSS